MFYLNTIEQLFLFVEQLFQLEVCLPYSRLLIDGIPILAVFQNLRWNSNKTPLVMFSILFAAIRSNVSMSDDLVIVKYLFYCIPGDNFSFQTKIKTGENCLLRVSI